MLNYLKKLFGFGPAVQEQAPVAPYKVEVQPAPVATPVVAEAPKSAEKAPAAPKAPRARKTAKPAAETAKPKAAKTAKPKAPKMTVVK